MKNNNREPHDLKISLPVSANYREKELLVNSTELQGAFLPRNSFHLE